MGLLTQGRHKTWLKSASSKHKDSDTEVQGLLYATSSSILGSVGCTDYTSHLPDTPFLNQNTTKLHSSYISFGLTSFLQVALVLAHTHRMLGEGELPFWANLRFLLLWATPFSQGPLSSLHPYPVASCPLSSNSQKILWTSPAIFVNPLD